jgi:phosphoenolpyruvate carboxykinase (ATP)
MAKELSYKAEHIVSPSQKELRQLTLKYVPAVLTSAYDNLDKITRLKARKAEQTYIIAPESDAGKYSSKTIDRAKAEQLIARQKEFIERAGKLISIESYLGLGKNAYAVRWLYTPESTNIAGMQQVLCFPRERVESKAQLAKPFKPLFQLVFTAGFIPEDMPGRVAILVDIDNYITYVMGSDYFGESKKGALRMLNQYVYLQGGLVMHAGAKVVHVGGKPPITMTILGLSGTGKTTTTFSKQGELTQPAQDDMVCLWPQGRVTVTESGCFAKTFGLSAESEPTIYYGTIHSGTWVENNFINPDGTYDFSKKEMSPGEVNTWREILIATGANSENVDKYIRGETGFADVVNEMGIPADGWDFVVWTENGRSIIPMSAIKDSAPLDKLPPVGSMGILNRDEGPDAATPGIVRFVNPEQSAGYFMLGETSKTSAAGKERGKTRSPFTQPFFPQAMGLQAGRFSELAATMSHVDMWMMNTGYVGGDERAEKEGKALKVKIRHSSAMLEAMLAGKVVWKQDPDFGYEIVDPDAKENAPLVAQVPAEILEPRRFFEREGRMEEYKAWVGRMKEERKSFLQKYNLDSEIIKAVCG